jgi:hypothetical protein
LRGNCVRSRKVDNTQDGNKSSGPRFRHN